MRAPGLYIAIRLSEATKREIRESQQTMRENARRGQFVDPDSLFIVLASLEPYDKNTVSAASRSMHLTRAEPFILTIGGMGAGGVRRQNRVYAWITGDGRREVDRLHFEVIRNLAAKGFRTGNQKYLPHITVGQNVLWKRNIDWGHVWSFFFPVIKQRITGLELVRVERVRGKTRYTTLYRYEFGAAEQLINRLNHRED
jgi:2'-5' RNA ligase